MPNPEKDQSLFEQIQWWRVSRLAERLRDGEAAPTWRRPYVQVRANEGGAKVEAREKLLMGPYLDTHVLITRDENYGHVLYVAATQENADTGNKDHFRGYPGGIEEESLSVSALCHVLNAAVAAAEHAQQPR